MDNRTLEPILAQPETLENINRTPMSNTYHRVFKWQQVVTLSTKEQFFYHYATLAAGTPIDLNSYTSVFDQYRIDRFSVTWRPAIRTPVALGAAPLIIPPQCISFIDFDGNVDPTTLTQALVRAYASSNYGDAGSPHSRTIVPRYLVWNAAEGSTGGNSTLATGWIDTNSPRTQHYGIGFYLSAMVSGASVPVTFDAGVFELEARISFRGGR